MCAITIGTMNTAPESVTGPTMHARPDNFAFYDPQA